MKLQTIWVADHVVLPVLMHSHGYYQMIYCKKVGGSFHIAGKHYEAEAGKVYFIQPMQPHAIHTSQGVHLVEAKFVVHDEAFARHLALLPTVFTPKDGPAFRRGIVDILKEGRNQALYSNDATNAALELLLIRLLRSYTDAAVEPLNRLGFQVPVSNLIGRQKSTDARVAQLIHWIEEHIAEEITLDTMSQLAQMNKSALVENFNRMCGMPPIQYVNWVRLEKAKDLLANTRKSITEIASETGFQNIHYFSRYFKTREGSTPNAYRKQIWEQ